MALILFIDDDVTTLQLMNKAAEVLGHQAILSSSSADAYDLALHKHPDLILIDQQLHDMDGCDLIECLMTGLGHTPIYLVSAYLSDQDLERARQAGAAGVLQKPVSLDGLAGIAPSLH